MVHPIHPPLSTSTQMANVRRSATSCPSNRKKGAVCHPNGVTQRAVAVGGSAASRYRPSSRKPMPRSVLNVQATSHHRPMLPTRATALPVTRRVVGVVRRSVAPTGRA